MKPIIITDSASDLTAGDELLRVLPIKVFFGEIEYLDGVTLSHGEFYEKLVECNALPTTSQIPPYEFEEAFRQAAQQGRRAIVITLSQKLSGTYQSAVLAAEHYPGIVAVIDSESVSAGQKVLVLYAKRLLEAGLSFEEIIVEIERIKPRVHVLALVDTLEYLKAGGRISKTAAIAGSVLSIKPVVAIQDGAVAVIGKARGSKNANNLLRELIASCGGIDFEYPVALGYTGLNDAMLQKYMRDSNDLYAGQEDKITIGTIGCTIGTHAGPGAVAIAFFARE